jgi:hypothetical protein
MAQAFIVGRAPGDDDPIVRDGEIVRIPLLLRDGNSFGGGLMMADGTSLTHRLCFASPQVRTALGLPAMHVENGVGGIAGHAPGYLFSPQQLHDRAHPRADDPRQRAYADYVDRLTSAWKTP